jgi:acetyltransferase-like isoleucine patch superfamily enzyme/dTDP-4-dehydrorhamnose 3,5-epimerase-like enzyme
MQDADFSNELAGNNTPVSSESETTSFIHPNALVDTGACIGARTRVWAFAHILSGAKIGADCNICDHVFIENDVNIGDRVTVKCGVQIWDGVTLEDDVFVGPNVTFSNDLFPRSRQHPDKFSKTLIRKGASLGANATILAGLEIGGNSMVGAGAVVTRSVPPNAIVVGNPARIKGYVSSNSAATNLHKQSLQLTPKTNVAGVSIHKLPSFVDMRGSLSFGEYGSGLPFIPKRYFIVYDVPSQEVRGEHTHKELHQFLVCIKGSCSVVVDDGVNREEILLNNPTVGLHIPPMIWATQYKYTPDAVLLVLASHPYDNDDYIRNYDDYLEALKS